MEKRREAVGVGGVCQRVSREREDKDVFCGMPHKKIVKCLCCQNFLEGF